MVILMNIINLYDNILINKYQGLVTCNRLTPLQYRPSEWMGERRFDTDPSGERLENICMRMFTGQKLLKWLSTDFKHWACGFHGELEMTQQACGYLWPEK